MEKLDDLELYNVQEDLSESFNIIEEHPEIIEEIEAMVKDKVFLKGFNEKPYKRTKMFEL